MNLVFNKWDNNGNPIPNLSELNSSEYYVTFPFFFEDINFNIKSCRLKDINKNETFYFIISYRWSYTFYIKNGEIFLPKEIEEYIKNFDLKVIFLSETESNKFSDVFLNLLIKKIKKNNWKEENFFIIDNNSKLHKTKDKFKTNVNIFKINHLITFFSKKNNPPSVNDIILDKKFIFLCQNRQPHYHRVLLLTYLKHLNLFENDITNWSLTMSHSDYMKYTQQSSNVLSLLHFKNYLDLNNTQLIKDYSYMCNITQLCYYLEDLDWKNTVNNFNHYDITNTIENSLNYQNSYINIVTESHYHYRDNSVHITEKSFKPFYFFQLPIFLASWEHIKMMREEYDLDFFDDLIDHSYDNEKDDAKRMHMVINEIKRLSNMREEIFEFYKNNVDRLIKNHNLIKNNNYKEIFKQYLLDI